MRKTGLLNAYRRSGNAPRLGADVRLNSSALQRIAELCDDRYVSCEAIVIRGFVRTQANDYPNDDMATVDVRLVLLDTDHKEVVNDYSLLCRFQPEWRSFEVMTIR